MAWWTVEINVKKNVLLNLQRDRAGTQIPMLFSLLVFFVSLHGYTFLWFLSTLERDDCATCRYCETLGPVGEEKNAFTGFAFTATGLVLSVFCAKNDSNLVFLGLYSLLGPGLMAMHLYQSTWAEHIDSMSLVVFLSFYYYHAISEHQLALAWIASMFVLIECSVLEFTVSAEARGWNVTVFILVVGFLDGFLKRKEYSVATGRAFYCCGICRVEPENKAAPEVPWYVHYAYVVYCAGQVAFFVGSSFQIAGRYSCDAGSAWQHHAAWHVFAALGLGLMFVAQDWIRYPGRDRAGYATLST